jgi:hypothetical protein
MKKIPSRALKANGASRKACPALGRKVTVKYTGVIKSDLLE